MSTRVSPVERIRADIDDLFDSDRDLGEVLEQVARLGARLPMQTAIEAEVTESSAGSATPTASVPVPRDAPQEERRPGVPQEERRPGPAGGTATGGPAGGKKTGSRRRKAQLDRTLLGPRRSLSRKGGSVDRPGDGGLCDAGLDGVGPAVPGNPAIKKVAIDASCRGC